MDKVAAFTEKERRDLFGETAARMNTVPAIAEKDFWVVWVLSKLFGHGRLKTLLQFKGGTSLSKAYDVIGRFSEDIDLILDWRVVAEDEPEADRSKTQQNNFNEATNEKAQQYIAKELLPIVADLVAPLCQCRIDQDNPFAIVVAYPALYDAGYLRSEILLEIGPLASWTPSAVFEIKSYAAIQFPELFENNSCQVPTILARRTFWEKVTILHQEAHRAEDKAMPTRYSRHYYDLAQLAQSAIRQEALADLALLEEVVKFKQRFYPSAWARYDLAKAGSLRIVPSSERQVELAEDYEKMQQMIFAKKLSMDEIIAVLTELEAEISSLATTG